MADQVLWRAALLRRRATATSIVFVVVVIDGSRLLKISILVPCSAFSRRMRCGFAMRAAAASRWKAPSMRAHCRNLDPPMKDVAVASMERPFPHAARRNTAMAQERQAPNGLDQQHAAHAASG
jgi:hypothetical protein